MRKKCIINTIECIMMLFWVSFLSNADSYRIPYLVITVSAFICFYINQQDTENGEEISRKLLFVSAGMFSTMTLAANYALLSGLEAPGQMWGLVYELGTAICLWVGGYFTAFHILSCTGTRLKGFLWKKHLYQIPPVAVFWIVFVMVSVVDLVLLFTCRYPGNLTPDSMSQIGQILSGNYSNHHPFYHTMVIRLFLSLGWRLFGEMNAAVAVYHVFQILFLAFCFSMVAVTLYEMHLSLSMVIGVAVWYLLMPFHIVYSFTMWKDVIFGGFVVLFLVFLYRGLRKIGKHRVWNNILLSISGFGICLCRSNGLFAFVIVFFSFLVLFGKVEKKRCVLFAGIIIVSFFMKHTVLDVLGVSQPDTAEALSIPLQQMARVITDQDDFTDAQRELLNQIIDVAAVPQTYVPWISDPVKELVRSRGEQQYLEEHKLDYLRLYVETGCKHPLSYIKAWIDETRGYWNAGYEYWRWADDVFENGYGIQRTVYVEWINDCLNGYLWLFSKNSFLQIFLCIGFYVWVDLFLCLLCIIRKDRVGLFLSVPVLSVIFSLLISTPVYSEFRYAYAVFCCLPFLIAAVLKGDTV